MIIMNTKFPRRSGPPAVEPVTLAEALVHLHADADGAENDAYITGLIVAARQACEARTERTLISTPWRLKMDAFPEAVELLQPPIISVQSVKYVDEAGVEQTINPLDYVVDTASEPGYLVPSPDASWPSTQSGAINTVTVDYTAGYGMTAADVPAQIVHWIKCALTFLYENRAGELPDDFAEGLIYNFRIRGV